MESLGGRRATILDVAHAAGVSKSLVSVALHGGGRISEETRARILRIADELGYRSNALAQSLVRGRTGLLGVIVTDLGNPYHADLARHIEAAADGAAVTAVILNGRRDAGRMADLVDITLQLQVEGLIVVSSWLPPERLFAAAREKPLVVVGRLPAELTAGQHLGFDMVHGHDEHGTAIALRHLRSGGHRRIAFLCGLPRPSQIARRDAYRAAMRRASCARYIEEYTAAPSDRDLTALLSRLTEADAPTAVFASNDQGAINLLRAAADRGIEVPADLSVIGYDNTTLAESWRPGLTSVSQPLMSIAETAVSLVASRIAGRTDDEHEVLKGELVLRATTAECA